MVYSETPILKVTSRYKMAAGPPAVACTLQLGSRKEGELGQKDLCQLLGLL